MADDAYRIIARSLAQHAPRPFKRVIAQFRIHPSMLSSEYAALRPDGKQAGFFVRGEADERLKSALLDVRARLPRAEGDAPFVRADFEFDVDGKFSFTPYYVPQLLARLAEILRANWPDGVKRLRLNARQEYDQDDGKPRWKLSYSDIGGAAPRSLPKPPSAGEFDTPLWLVTDLGKAIRVFETLDFELARSGDDYRLLLDGASYQT